MHTDCTISIISAAAIASSKEEIFGFSFSCQTVGSPFGGQTRIYGHRYVCPCHQSWSTAHSVCRHNLKLVNRSDSSIAASPAAYCWSPLGSNNWIALGRIPVSAIYMVSWTPRAHKIHVPFLSGNVTRWSTLLWGHPIILGSVAAVPVKSQFVTKTITWFKPNQCKQDPGNVPIWNWLVKSWFQFINRSLTVPWVLLIMLSATSDHWPLTTHNTVHTPGISTFSGRL